jgi:predicted RNA binding protein YcfA (HicA-like mRNA interferase family)
MSSWRCRTASHESAPVTRAVLIRRLQSLGFEGPFVGGRHQFMIRGSVRLIAPNPHRQEIGLDLLSRILRQAGVSRNDWLSS